MIRLPPCCARRQKSCAGISNAPTARPPDAVPRPPPLMELLKARAMRVIESSRINTSWPASTRRLARSMANCAMRVWLLRSLSLEEAMTSAPGTLRRISVTSSGRSSTSRMISFISAWFLTTASAICCSKVVLPVRGGATIKPRCPFADGRHQVHHAGRIAFGDRFQLDALFRVDGSQLLEIRQVAELFRVVPVERRQAEELRPTAAAPDFALDPLAVAQVVFAANFRRHENIGGRLDESCAWPRAESQNPCRTPR